jgi:kinetochore protein NNF1
MSEVKTMDEGAVDRGVVQEDRGVEDEIQRMEVNEATAGPTECSESIRYQRLKQICSRSLQESIKYLTIDRLMACYPTVVLIPKSRQVMEQALAQITAFWESTAEKEFAAVFEEKNIGKKLDELETLIEEAQTRKRTPSNERVAEDDPVMLDQLTAQQIVNCNVRKVQLERIVDLESQIERIKQDNSQLQSQLVVSQRQSAELCDLIIRSFQELEDAAGSAKKLPSRMQLAGFFADVAHGLQPT